MKQPERVAKLLAELRALTENDFERHRIDVLEKDLIAPPTVEVIDDKHQCFNGVTYTKNNHGHFSTPTSIHRVVWSYYHGKIPQGDYVIHHIDQNKGHNDIDNLQILAKSVHSIIHNAIPRPEKICPVCGKKFIPQNNHQIYCSRSCSAKCEASTTTEKICPVCGKIFIKKRNRQIYCSTNCRILRQKNYEQRTCVICGKGFSVSINHPEKKTCSPHCAGQLASLSRGGHLATPRKCAICGKEFIPRHASSKERACSPACGHKLAQRSRKANSCK